MSGTRSNPSNAELKDQPAARRAGLALAVSVAVHLALLLGYQPPQQRNAKAPTLELRVQAPPPERPEPEPAQQAEPLPEPPSQSTPELTAEPTAASATTAAPRSDAAGEAETDDRADQPTERSAPELTAATIRRQARAVVRRQARPGTAKPMLPENWTAPVLPSRPQRPELLEPLFYTGRAGVRDEWQEPDGTYHATAVTADGNRMCIQSVTLMPMTDFEATILTFKSCGQVRGGGGGTRPLEEFHGRTDPMVEHFKALHDGDE